MKILLLVINAPTKNAMKNNNANNFTGLFIRLINDGKYCFNVIPADKGNNNNKAIELSKYKNEICISCSTALAGAYCDA